jgi:hypothetical protein
MSGAPDSEFAKIFELLNGYEGSDEIEPPPLPSPASPPVRSAAAVAPAKRPQPKPDIPAPPLPARSLPAQSFSPQPPARTLPPQPLTAPETEVENSFAAHIAAAMAKRADR